LAAAVTVMNTTAGEPRFSFQTAARFVFNPAQIDVH
jgi:hypothetical protein